MVSDVYQSGANESTAGITVPHWPFCQVQPDLQSQTYKNHGISPLQDRHIESGTKETPINPLILNILFLIN